MGGTLQELKNQMLSTLNCSLMRTKVDVKEEEEEGIDMHLLVNMFYFLTIRKKLIASWALTLSISYHTFWVSVMPSKTISTMYLHNRIGHIGLCLLVILQPV